MLPFGGIREIEFFIQTNQLLFGGRNKALRVRGSLSALRILKGEDIISEEDFLYLSKAYIFLRNLENRGIELESSLKQLDTESDTA